MEHWKFKLKLLSTGLAVLVLLRSETVEWVICRLYLNDVTSHSWLRLGSLPYPDYLIAYQYNNSS